MKKTITRVRFCNSCFQAGRPYDGMKFLVYGSTNQRSYYHYYSAPTHSEIKSGERTQALLGFVPHLFTVDKVNEDGTFHVIYSCSCDGCDLTFKEVSDNRWKPEIHTAHTMVMTPKEWEDLTNFVNTGYEI